jgi:hypothetical protein
MLPANEKRIEEVAEKALKSFSLYDTVAPDMITIIIKLKHLGLIKDYQRVADDELPDDEALYNSYDQILMLRESVFMAANFPYDYSSKMMRARFTIAHEIGHILLKHKGIRHRNVSGRGTEIIRKNVLVEEIEANRFASPFLMPRHQIERLGNLTSEEISEKHFVSNQAAQIRIEQIERIKRRQDGIMRPSPDSVRKYLEEARSKGFSIKSLDD